MEFTSLTRDLGVAQGRIAPAGFTPVGSYAFVLGTDVADAVDAFNVGDYVEVSQNADFGTDTSGAAATITAASGGNVTLTGLAGLDAGVIGRTIQLSGCANPANNGRFTVTAFISATSVVISNSAGVFPDANSGSIAWTAYAVKLVRMTARLRPQLARAGTGTASASGTAVTGTGTKFTEQLAVGWYIVLGGQTRRVTAIGSNTSLTVDTAFTGTPSGSYQIGPVWRASLRVDGTELTSRDIVHWYGSYRSGTRAPRDLLDLVANVSKHPGVRTLALRLAVAT